MLNELMVRKFVEVFGKQDNINDTDPTNDFVIPIIPTFGNNDMLPHNILAPGPNKWTQKYLSIWAKFIPEEQRHGFERGGWFYVEVIPNKLAVFSLNTMYFFDSNSAVDGCAEKSEPGYAQMEWLRIQLRFLRERGMKAIMMGHVPPARTETKISWDETCWQKYTLWMRQYRDVVVGSVYGHMNIDHFMLQDSKDINRHALEGELEAYTRVAQQDELTVQSSADYLTDLRTQWSRLPSPSRLKEQNEDKQGRSSARGISDNSAGKKKKKGKKNGKQKFEKKIGGPWGERYSLALVGPSIVPNYFPTLRVIEYNITGLDVTPAMDSSNTIKMDASDPMEGPNGVKTHLQASEENEYNKSSKRKKHKKLQKPKFKIPDPPSKTSPPGPAYSAQTLTWLGYTQYFANLTKINNDFTQASAATASSNDMVEGSGWKEGKYHDRKPHDKDSRAHTKKFKFEVEYDTRDDQVYKLKDLTVRSYLNLAARIGQYKPKGGDHIQSEHRKEAGVSGDVPNRDLDVENPYTSSKATKKHKKHKKRKAINKVWFTFVQRAYVGTRDDDEIHDEFGQRAES